MARPSLSTREQRVKHRSAFLLGMIVMLVALPGFAGAPPAEPVWQELEPGLQMGTFISPQPAAAGDSRIRVLRIDPARFELRLFNASALTEKKAITPKEWITRYGLTAAINASMYQSDYRTSVSLMRTRVHTNNGALSKDNAVLAFDRLDDGVPRAQIIDRTCQDFDELKKHYGTLVQSIRMVSCDRKNVWSPREERWSTAAIGMDQDNRILFIHARALFRTHDLIDALLALPIGLKTAMYVEGGPQAQLHVHSGGRDVTLVGSYDPAVLNGDEAVDEVAIPNVVGIVPIAQQP